ncbi:hypothetical protein H0H81_011838 [Sphagnurus paluster]|uniref:Uncharacterized protein n=1 Tax=Sphagnurus paluster TaxID=117069 RepID=A0A9P7FTX7_9AGAR|nr:hypothetical protein H0H81_011838 [Sphagnurus paluster]
MWQNSLQSSVEVAVVIGFESCPTYSCHPASDGIGTVLYNGKYNPQYRTPGLPPYQNFSVLIPFTAPQGPAQLNLAHFALTGAGLAPFLETSNVTVFVL